MSEELSWQAQKSILTREAILDAAIECLIDLGYAGTTTALIAEHAGVSRGAMLHHFPSRAEVFLKTIEYLHEKRLRAHQEIFEAIDCADRRLDGPMILKWVRATWKFYNLPVSVAYLEVLVASRSDENLRKILEPLESESEEESINAAKAIFRNSIDLEVLVKTNNVLQILLTGLGVIKISSNNSRTEVLLNQVADNIECMLRQQES